MTVKELREKYKLTQSALAKSLGVSSNAISAVEAGRLKLSNKLTAKIMEVYGEDVTAAPAVKLSGGTPSMPPCSSFLLRSIINRSLFVLLFIAFTLDKFIPCIA